MGKQPCKLVLTPSWHAGLGCGRQPGALHVVHVTPYESATSTLAPIPSVEVLFPSAQVWEQSSLASFLYDHRENRSLKVLRTR